MGSVNVSGLLMEKPVGRCLGMSPNIFFPRTERGETSDEARRVCSQCWATEACLEYAVLTGQTTGIYAGMNLRERRVAAKERGLSRRTGRS